MSFWSLIALVSGTLGVWLTIRQTIYCWPVSLLAVVVSIIEFYNQRLFGDMSLQIFYFFAGIYGWIYWSKKQSESFIVSEVNINAIPFLIIITLVQSVVYYYLLIHFRGDRPLL